MTPTSSPQPHRYENKLVYPATHLAQVRTWLRLHPEGFLTHHPPRTIHNIYFDTPDLASFNQNLSGIATRRKWRLRWFGQLTPTIVNPTLEWKRKDGLVGDKLRLAIPDTFDLTQTWHTLMTALRTHLPPLWQIRFPPTLSPVLYNRYHREYYVTPDLAIRATIDYQPAACDQRLHLRPNLTHHVPLPDNLVIEIKGDPQHALRIQNAMSIFPLHRIRHSKYVNGILASPIF